jgi:two-component system, chemotaxis family, protein-glutamate methylesterase/glutaminase
MIRVLVVDDSAFARKVVREVLSQQPDLEIIAIARDGAEALELIAQLQPDVVTLDLVMPTIDGLGVLSALPATGGPRVVVVSVSGATTELGIAALELGAVALIEKPTPLASERLYEIGRDLVAAVRAAAAATPRRFAPAPPPPVIARPPVADRVVVIGASTGGPPALTRLLAALPADLGVPVLAVVHLPAEYTEAFARRMDKTSPLAVREASDGAPLVAGEVLIARGGYHLRIAGRPAAARAVLAEEPADTLFRPSVDVLFTSAAEVYGAGVLGVVLTGMGDDGTAGARAIVRAGGAMLTETEASCVVYGMPRSVVDAGLSAGQAALEDMAPLIVERLARR